MIKHYGKLALAHLGLVILFVGITLWGEPNMFTLPIAMIFMTVTVFCTLQWYASRLFAKIEKKNPKWS